MEMLFLKTGRKIIERVGLLMIALFFVAAVSGCGEEKGGNAGGGAEQPSAQANRSADDNIDACKVVTQEDATKLFGKPASPQEGTPVLDPSLMSECLWTWDTEMSNQLLQFYIWNGEQYYGETPGAQSINLGDKGFIRVNEFAGVDIEWIQDGKTISLSYSTIGTEVPDATTKAEEVKSLARKIEGQL